MSTKHTPGPWNVSIAFAEDHPRIQIKSDNEILKVGPANGVAVCLAGYVQNEESQANAKLIAAAPELLEALKQIMQSEPLPKHLSDYAEYAIQKAEQ